MKEVTYSRTIQAKQYEPFVVTATIERTPGESLVQFIARSIKEFAMLYQASKVLRK